MSNEFDYTKLKHLTSLDQSDREVPYNLRQSGPTKVELLISTRVRKSPYWHLSMKAGCWRATVYNRIYHPRGYVKPEDGGAMVEYDAIVNHVTMWERSCRKTNSSKRSRCRKICGLCDYKRCYKNFSDESTIRYFV